MKALLVTDDFPPDVGGIAAYLRDVPAARLPAVIDEVPRRHYFHLVPRRSA